MTVKNVFYSKNFIKKLKLLPRNILELAIEKEKLFKLNPLHTSLRLHALHGKLEGAWSISITGNYRIIFIREKNGDLTFVSIGKHAIYRSV